MGGGGGTEGAGYSRIFSCGKISVYILCVGRKVWICAIYGLRCAKHGFVLHATIHGFACMDAKYKFEDNPWIALCKQLIAWFTRRFSLRY